MLPSLDACGHVPREACGSPHSGIPVRDPSSPGGVATWTPARSPSRSSRPMVTVSGLYCPASGLDVPALKDGANGGLAAHSPSPDAPQPISKGEVEFASGVTGVLHGVRSEVASKVPHA